MIFVTVGTHEQPFNRLIRYVDGLKRNKIIEEDFIIQTGYSTYEPQCCTWRNMYSYQSMVEIVHEARIVVTHGGPSSFIMPLQMGKIPIVIPRQKKYNEHVNDHQVRFAKEVEKRMGTIITVIDIEKLGDIILNYNSIIDKARGCMISNNEKFNKELSRIVDEMFEKKRNNKC